MVSAYEAAIKSLWKGLCTVSVKQNATDPATGRVVQTPVDTIVNEPCRISFDTVSVPENADGAAKALQTITLFIASSAEIPAGSKITVTQSGVTEIYEQSGAAAVYTRHKEIPLKLVERWT